MVTQKINYKTLILSSKLFNSCSKWAQWWDEVISKWKMIFIIVNNYWNFTCFMFVTIRTWCFKGCAPEAPGCSWQHTFAFEHETRFTILHKTLPFPKNGHKCLKLYTKDNNEENKGHKILFGVHWTGKTGPSKMRHAPLHTNLLSLPQRDFTATITFKN